MTFYTGCTCGDGNMKIETSRHKAIIECPHCGVRGVRRMNRPKWPMAEITPQEGPMDAARGIVNALVIMAFGYLGLILWLGR